jgi:DNA-directed RNA polymerase subunit alpha
MKQYQFEKTDSFVNENGEQTTHFCLKTLDSSHGITIGNTLRRVLLTDLPGTAITAVKINGIKHEYGIIPGFREDILELLLNLKQVKFKGLLEEPYYTNLAIKGPSLITAINIPVEAGLSVINSRQYIGTLSAETDLEIELKIESGKGYRLLTNDIQRTAGPFLHIDSIFTPVKNVNYKILDSYRFDEKDVEDLNLEITTDGSLTPNEALVQAAQILESIFGSLAIDDPTFSRTIDADASRKVLIEELQLSVRAYNCLKQINVTTIDDLVQYSLKELKEIKNFGQKSAHEVVKKLKDKFDIRLN